MTGRALVVADIHGRVDRLSEILARFEDAETVFIAGDIAGSGGEADARAVVEVLHAGSKPRRVVAVAGNCDSAATRDFLERAGCSAESRSLDLGFARVAGAGGGLFRGGHTGFERSEEELAFAMETALGDPEGAGGALKPIVALSHTPPRDTPADIRFGRHAGSRSFGTILSEREPSLWICGHIHESRCAAMVGRCLVLNPGPCAYGCYAIVDFGPAALRGGRPEAAPFSGRPSPREGIYRPLGL